MIILQGIIWGFTLLTLFTYIGITLFIPYFLFKIIGIKLFKYLVNIIYFFTITSLIFWGLQVISPVFDAFVQNLKDIVFTYSSDLWPRTLIIYTVSIFQTQIANLEIFRNSGIFHEPGAYALWLIFAIGINTIITKKNFDKKNILMMLALVTTFSTAGYIELFILFIFLISRSRFNPIIKFGTYIIFIFLSIFLYQNTVFLAEKVNSQYQVQPAYQLEGTYTTGRFIRIYKMLNVIGESPVIGRGIITASANDDPYSQYYLTGTGTLKLVANYGILFGILFFLYYYFGIRRFIRFYKYQPSFAIFFLIALIIGGLTQDYFYDAISIQFFLLGFFNWKSLLFENISYRKKLRIYNSPFSSREFI